MIRLFGTGAVSILALGIYSIGQALSQSSNLPPVTVDAPAPRAVSRPAPPKRTATARGPARRTTTPPAARVEAARVVTPATGTIGAPPAAYAGGQVATATRLGALGNRNIFDVPFSVVGYTAKTIQDQGARTISDVIANDPSIKAGWNRNFWADQFSFRGFLFSPSDTSFDGVYGLLDSYRIPVQLYERVELIKGPTAFVNGISPGGSIIGGINVVPKRAPDGGITQLTASYISNSIFGAHIDVGRRFGERNEFGIRFNGLARSGDTAVNANSEQAGAAELGLDYRGENVRASLDIGGKAERTKGPFGFYTVATGLQVPKAPDPTINAGQPWQFGDVQHGHVLGRVEVDLSEYVTAFAAAGASKTVPIFFGSTIGAIQNATGNFNLQPGLSNLTNVTETAEAGLRANFRTGPFDHRVTISGTGLFQDQTYIFNNVGPALPTNIYNPTYYPEPNRAGFSTVPLPSSKLALTGVALSETLSWQERVFLTVGVRHQQILNEAQSPTTGAVTSRYDTSADSPIVGLVVKPTKELSLYGSFAEGLQQGGTAPIGSVNAGEIFAPFVIKQAEIGAKYDFGAVGLTLAAYEIKQPSAFLDGSTNRFLVGGEQRNRGVELNAFGSVTPNLRVLGGVAFLDGVLVKTQNNINNGKTAIGAPDFSLNAGAEWDTPFLRDFTLTGRVIHTSSQFRDAANLQSIPSWTRFDLGARYVIYREGKPIVLRLSVENVAGTAYWSTAARGFLALGAPRTFLASTTFNF